MDSKKGSQVSGSNSFVREQYDKLLKESKILKQKVETLEKENIALKNSLYNLSATYSISNNSNKHPFIFDFENDKTDNEELTETQSERNEEVLMEQENFKNTYHFSVKHKLKGHAGAVYTIDFSPSGDYLASGSFDKSICIWDPYTGKKLKQMIKHTMNVTDLCWSNDSIKLISGSFDQTCKLWDIETGKMINSFDYQGFVQCVKYNPKENNIFFSGTTKKLVVMKDIRKPTDSFIIENNSMINTIYVYNDGTYVITGDSLGYIKTWDIRTGKCVNSILNEQKGQPVSHITVSKRFLDDEEPRYLSVNSYDNIIRVYDRGFSPPSKQCKNVLSLKGYKNRNWPIKSSFNYYSIEKSGILGMPSSSDENLRANRTEQTNFKDDKLNMSILLATGSSDSYAYIYSLKLNQEGFVTPIQRLEGHTGIVYATSFHPSNPILATCSADCTIRIWNSKVKNKV
ncbi:WD40 repeat-like protein [Neocallimastix lanati (nom. inval.)]|jgi:COMPASS component SWD3|nr:WD40 repeat-like protein [Neocallimastix sp. JGI-2020a]